jgi:hypothetical protein
MRIIYADDAPAMVEEICQKLREQGHEAVGLATDHLLEFQDRLQFMLEDGFKPDILIIGGHNHLRDANGTPLLDMDAFTIQHWLEQIETASHLENCRLVLFSRDEALRETALEHPEWGFEVVVAKHDASPADSVLEALGQMKDE